MYSNVKSSHTARLCFFVGIDKQSAAGRELEQRLDGISGTTSQVNKYHRSDAYFTHAVFPRMRLCWGPCEQRQYLILRKSWSEVSPFDLIKFLSISLCESLNKVTMSSWSDSLWRFYSFSHSQQPCISSEVREINITKKRGNEQFPVSHCLLLDGLGQ